MDNINELDNLIKLISKLPGLGHKKKNIGNEDD